MRLNMRFATTTAGSSTFTFDLFTLTVVEAWELEVVKGANEDSADAFLLSLVLPIGAVFPSNKDA